MLKKEAVVVLADDIIVAPPPPPIGLLGYKLHRTYEIFILLPILFLVCRIRLFHKYDFLQPAKKHLVSMPWNLRLLSQKLKFWGNPYICIHNKRREVEAKWKR
jgi:hypothetical protein